MTTPINIKIQLAAQEFMRSKFCFFSFEFFFFYITEGDINLFSCNNNLGISRWLVSRHKVKYQWLAEKLTTNSILVSFFFLKIHVQNILASKLNRTDVFKHAFNLGCCLFLATLLFVK